ncbi:serine/threonine-protein kinase [Haloechinothrix aidingensis]|uniref:serine/threonine-protein kinase n=1 Tax=Haloechinothrix aidingensis TaxID=2752311 RepID=UPI0031B63931
MSDEGQLVADRYRITRRIGTGAMGAVWQGRDELLGRVVAIKQLLLQPGLEAAEAEEARQRTMREGRIAARLHHPNAITVFDAVTDEHGQPCLIMEYLESTSLATVIQDRGSVPPLEVARIGEQVASALKSAHQVGIVHRDIKPGNVLLTDDGIVKITDFGISKAKDDVSVTKTGLIAGTPAYLAPEVALGNEPGPESDVFSLGSTLYAATEGQPPFGLSENTLSLLHAVAAGQINPPVQSGPLTSVLALLLHPEKEQRPDAERAEEVLAAVARGETPVGGPVTQEAGAAGAGAAGAGEDPADKLYDGDVEQASTSGTLTGLATDGPDATRVAPIAAMGSEPGPEGAGADTDAEHDRSGRRWKPLAASGLAASIMVALAVWVFAEPDTSHGESPTPPVTDDTTEPTTSAERTSTTTRSRTTTEPEPEPEPTPRPARTTDTGDPTDSTTTSRDTTTHPTSSETGGADTGGEETGGGGDDGTADGGDTGGDETGGGDDGTDGGGDDGTDGGDGGADGGGDDGTDGGDGGADGAGDGDQNTATSSQI